MCDCAEEQGRPRFRSVMRIWSALVLLCATTAFAGTGSGKLEPVTKTVGSINVSVDPRIELLTVVQYLSGYRDKGPFPLLTTLDFKYVRDVDAYFAPYRTHRAVTLFEQMRRQGFMFSRPVEAVLYCSSLPDMRLTRPSPVVPETGISAAQSAARSQQVSEFIAVLADFAVTSQFADFYSAHRTVYEQAVNATAANLSGADNVRLIEQYYGMKQAGYNLVLMIMGHPGGYGPRIARPDGTFEVYSVMGPKSASDGAPVFGSREQVRLLVWHEFSHPFINPTTERNRDLVARYASAFERIRKAMEAQAAGDWESTVEEHIIRAVNIRLTQLQMGEEAAAALQKQETGSGFLYVEALCRALRDYEQLRDRYRTIEDFYPMLMEAFASYKPDTGCRHEQVEREN